MPTMKPTAGRDSSLAVAVLACLLLSLPASAQSFELRYFYDDVKERLHFTDLAFASPQRGIGIGVMVDDTEGFLRDSVSVITSDGGKTWELTKLDDYPVSLFFLDDSLGWMVGERGIWKTLESGRSWTRISKHDSGDVRSLWFESEQHGFAVGERARVLETVDGGKIWSPVPLPEGIPENTLFTEIAFSGQRGFIVGVSGDVTPFLLSNVWLYPERFADRPPILSETVELHTLDGGKTWSMSRSTQRATVAEIALYVPPGTDSSNSGDLGDALVLFDYRQANEVPSQLFYVDLITKTGQSVFSEQDRLMTSVALFPPQEGAPRAFLVGMEPPGTVPVVPVPGPILAYQSFDLIEWEPVEVDYRAVARSAVLAGTGPENLWIATDYGMILQLSNAVAEKPDQ